MREVGLTFGTNRMLFLLIREKTKSTAFMVPLGELDIRNRVRIPSYIVKPKISCAPLISVSLSGF